MKSKTEFVCNKCGYKSAKWLGKCPSCEEWDSFEELVVLGRKAISLIKQTTSVSVRLSDIQNDSSNRLQSGVNEFDRVLGGGIVPGSLILIGGDPGIGKSTLMLQICNMKSNYSALYVTGEESLHQIKRRASRLKSLSNDLLILAETNLEQIISVIQNSETQIVIVDSIQSVNSSKVESTAGSIMQVRECASMLLQTAKQLNKAIIIVGHVTKDGYIAGPKLLEHMVDTVLQFEGDKTYSYRILRSLKNRYGSTNEIGVFDMQNDGLQEISNPSEIFLMNRNAMDPGISIVAAIEGTRPILLEVQALVSPSGYSMPQRTAVGIEFRRLQMILAVLEKRLGIPFRNYDVFINIAGGIYLNDPAIDLGIASALVSSQKDIPIRDKTVIIGEIGLTGEVRPVNLLEQRVAEAEKLGMNNAFIPKSKNQFKNSKINILTVERISLALADIFS